MVYFFATSGNGIIATATENLLNKEDVEKLCWLYSGATPVDAESVEGYNRYFDAEVLKNKGTSGNQTGNVDVMVEGDTTYARFYGTETGDPYFYLYRSSQDANTTPTGQYLVFKYRMPTTNVTNSSYFQVYASTTTKSFTADGVELSAKGSVKKDGEWHTIIIDLSDIETYVPNEKGDYIAKLPSRSLLYNSIRIQMPKTEFFADSFSHTALAAARHTN